MLISSIIMDIEIIFDIFLCCELAKHSWRGMGLKRFCFITTPLRTTNTIYIFKISSCTAIGSRCRGKKWKTEKCERVLFNKQAQTCWIYVLFSFILNYTGYEQIFVAETFSVHEFRLLWTSWASCFKPLTLIRFVQSEMIEFSAQ